MKKLLAILTAISFVLLAGCLKKDGDESSQNIPESKTSSTHAESSEVESQDEPEDDIPETESPQSIPNPDTVSNPVEETNTLPSDFSKLDSAKQGWGSGTNVNEENRPVSPASFQEKYAKYDAIFIKENDKKIYLTFDEGYENGYTPQILDTLKEKKVKAVFFVTYDYTSKNPELIRRMIDEGHVVGNHTWSHPSLPTLSIDKAAEEITKLHDYIKNEFNYNMTLLRPPMGEFSEQTLALTQSLGYKTVMWSFAYKDWETDNQPEPSAALERIVNSAHGGGVYLLHAVSQTNTQILGDVIGQIIAKGFSFEPLK